jgi:phage-related protein
LIILGNAFQKKSFKLPKKEIDKAVKIMEEYFHEKEER